MPNTPLIGICNAALNIIDYANQYLMFSIARSMKPTCQVLKPGGSKQSRTFILTKVAFRNQQSVK